MMARRRRPEPRLDPAMWRGLLGDRLGLASGGDRWEQCEAAIKRAMARVRVEDPAAFRSAVEGDPRVFDALIEEVTVGETYFFREPGQFAFLRDHAIPERLRTRETSQPFTIWSAGCASGEEPYSLAILFDQLELPPPRIVATDVSAARLHAARTAVYGRWSLRGVSEDVIVRYFRRSGVHFRLADRIRGAVEFRQLNLAEDLHRNLPVRDADLVVCRNVLIYLEPAVVRAATRALVDALAPGGWLFLGPSDPPLTEMPGHAGCEVIVTEAGLAYRRRITPDLPRVVQTRHAARVAELGVSATSSARPDAAPAPRVHELPPAVRPRALADEARGAIARIRELADAGHELAAAEACETALAAYGSEPELWLLRALLLTRAARFAEATQAARRALYLDRGLAMAHVALGMAESGSGNVRAARLAFDNALAALQLLDPAAVVAAAGGETAGRLAAAVQRHLHAMESVP